MSPMRRQDPEPETRVGNCCGCNSWPVPLTLFKVPGVYRYRCDACFEVETGFSPHLAPAKASLSQLEPLETV